MGSAPRMGRREVYRRATSSNDSASRSAARVCSSSSRMSRSGIVRRRRPSAFRVRISARARWTSQRKLPEPPLPAPEAAREHRIDQHETADPLRMAVSHVHRDLGAEAVTDDDGGGEALGVEHLDEIARPHVATLSAAHHGSSIATQIGGEDAPRLGQRGALDELGPASVIAGRAMQENQQATLPGGGAPDPVGQIDAVGGGQLVFRARRGRHGGWRYCCREPSEVSRGSLAWHRGCRRGIGPGPCRCNDIPQRALEDAPDLRSDHRLCGCCAWRLAFLTWERLERRGPHPDRVSHRARQDQGPTVVA